MIELRRAEHADAPGFYAMSAAAYHRDPCPAPSLSNSIAGLLLNRSPRHAWLAHPRFGGQSEHAGRKAELGTVAHRLLTGRGGEIVVIDADNYRTKVAQAERDQALADGHLPVLAPDLAAAERMVELAFDRIDIIEGCERAFQVGAGHGEVVMVWREGEVWCRSMLDWLDAEEPIVWDYKTTTDSAHPQAVSRRLFNSGADMQAAFYERGLVALKPEFAGRVRFRFVVHEVERPHEMSVVELDEAALIQGRRKVETAIRVWQRCTAKNDWPGYPRFIARAELPIWHERDWMDREAAASALAEVRRSRPRAPDAPAHDALAELLGEPS
jgi:hypothetical protein